MKNFFQKTIKENKKRGFTILETMVAIFILVLSITGPMVFAQSGLRTAFLSRDQITAFFLAQDAIETIKNIRDDNGLDGRDWLENIYVCGADTTQNCVIYIDTLAYEPVSEICSGSECPILKVNSNNQFGYNFDVGENAENSRFTRILNVKEVAPGRELQIVAEIRWTSNIRVGGARILVQENIYNWIPNTQPATP